MMYFHIQNKQEVRLIKAAREDTVMLPKRDKLTYYRTGCTYPQVSTNNCSSLRIIIIVRGRIIKNLQAVYNESPSFD